MRSQKTKATKTKKIKKAKPATKKSRVSKKSAGKKAKSRIPAKLGRKILVKAVTDIKPTETISMPAIEAPALVMAGKEPEAFEFDEQIFTDFNDEAQPEEVEEIDEDLPPEQSSLSIRHKHIILYVAIISIMTVVVGFWFSGIRYSLGQSLKDYSDIGDPQATERVKKAFSDFANTIFSIVQTDTGQVQQPATNNNINQAIKQKIIEQQLKDSIVDQMQKKIENIQFETK
jgi:hypothetical protein